MVDFSLKAAAIDKEQLGARGRAMTELGLPVNLELHTFGARDIDSRDSFKTALANVERFKADQSVNGLVVHVPLPSVAVVTSRDFDADQGIRGIEFADRVGAEGHVLPHSMTR